MNRLRPFAAFRHPLYVAALALLLLNDHVLKQAGVLPSVVTGKLSDFAGLIVAPAVIALVCRVRSQRGWLLAHLAVGAGFTALNVSTALAASYGHALTALGIPSKLWADPTDLVALPTLLVSYWILGKHATGPSSRAHAPSRLLVALAALSCVATSRAAPARVAAGGSLVAMPLFDEDGTRIVLLDAQSGEAVRELGLNIQARPTPVIHGGLLVGIVRDPDDYNAGFLVAVDLKSGNVRYREPVRSWFSDSALLANDDIVLLTEQDDSAPQALDTVVNAYDLNTGKRRWKRKVDDQWYRAYYLRDHVVLMGGDERLERLDAKTGQVRWEVALSDDPVCLTELKGRVFAQLGDEVIAAIDDASGQIVGEREIDAYVYASGVPDSCSMASSTESLFIATPDGRLVLDERMRQRALIPDVGRVAAKGDVVVEWGSRLSRLDPKTGAILWRSEPGYWHDVPTIDGGLIFIMTDTEVIAYDANTGKPRWLRPQTHREY